MNRDSTAPQIFVVTEQEILVEKPTSWEAIKSLYGAYFAFNIEYPKSSLAFLKFLDNSIF